MLVSRETQEARKRNSNIWKGAHSPLQPLPQPLPSPTGRWLEGKDLGHKQCHDGIWIEHQGVPCISVLQTAGLRWDKTKRKCCLFIIFLFCSFGDPEDSNLNRNSILPKSGSRSSDCALSSSELFCSWRQGEKSKKGLITCESETTKGLADLNKGEFSEWNNRDCLSLWKNTGKGYEQQDLRDLGNSRLH